MSETYRIPPQTTTGSIDLAVADLDRSLRFYEGILGLQVQRSENRATLCTPDGAPIISLEGVPGARPKPARSTGLYHFAILVPSRHALASVIARLQERNYPIQGASDHGVSEAIYLADPDGNGIEIYRDRPRAEWPKRDGALVMVTDPLDAQGVMAELGPGENSGLPAGTRLGHVHLHVRDIPEAERFYRDLLGLDLMQRYGPSAAFLSAGGYHHHVGVNTWAGIGAPPPPADAVGLRYFSLLLPDAAELTRAVAHLRSQGVEPVPAPAGWLVRDPSANGILLTTDPTA